MKVKHIILKSILIICIIACIGVVSYFLLKNADFVALKNQLGDTIWFWAIISLLQVVQVVFIPVSNQIISVPVALLFRDQLWKVFLASWIGIEIGTIILYFIGRFGGKKLLGWILGDKEQVEKCTDFLKKGKEFYIVGMLIGFIPDDILTVLAGTAKYSFAFVLPVSMITRGICCAFSVWGFGWLTQFWWGWLLIVLFFIALLVITVIVFKRTKQKN